MYILLWALLLATAKWNWVTTSNACCACAAHPTNYCQVWWWHNNSSNNSLEILQATTTTTYKNTTVLYEYIYILPINIYVCMAILHTFCGMPHAVDAQRWEKPCIVPTATLLTCNSISVCHRRYSLYHILLLLLLLRLRLRSLPQSYSYRNRIQIHKFRLSTQLMLPTNADMSKAKSRCCCCGNCCRLFADWLAYAKWQWFSGNFDTL